MILLLDFGNSRLKWAVLEAGVVGTMNAMAHQRQDCPDLVGTLLARYPLVQRLLAVSVLDAETETRIAERVQQNPGCHIEFVRSAASGFGIRSGYRDPTRLGADRFVAMIAAHHRYRSDCLVVDCGTAVTIDALKADGEHLGGVIAPGLALMRESLSRRAIGLAAPAAGEPVLFGCDTADGLHSGCLRLLAGGIEGICRDMSVHLSHGAPRVLCGGDAAQVAPLLGGPYHTEPSLIINGLAVIAAAR